MIITRNDSLRMYRQLDVLKSISRLIIEEGEFAQWCHNLNVINALAPDQYELAGRWNLNQYYVDSSLSDLVLPFQVTLDGDVTQVNLLDHRYCQYNNETAVAEYGYRATEVAIMAPEDFNLISDAIMGAFKKVPNETKVDTLKPIAPLADYKKRDARGEFTYGLPDANPGWVPVRFRFNFKQNRYYIEDVRFVFNHWWTELLKKHKGAKQASAPGPDQAK